MEATARFDFRGEEVLVTGASRGIGHAVAHAFAAAGARVTVVAQGKEIEDAARDISTETGSSVVGLRCDIADPEAVRELLARFDRLDVLVNNAGLELPTPVTADDPQVDDTFRRIIDVNVLGTWSVTRAAVPKMTAGSRILVTSSIWGRTAVPGFSAYVSSKHALLGMTRTLAQELGPRGIRVNAVCPGWVRTEAAMRSLQTMAAERNVAEADLLSEIAGAQALDGLMEPPDVAGIYLYLASGAAANITGQAINVDRGEVLA